MHSISWETVTSHQSKLGEGPVWDEKEERILWLDILSSEIHAFYTATGRHTTLATGQLIGAAVLTTDGSLLAAMQNGFYKIREETGAQQFLGDPEAHLPDNRFNDGKCDPRGRFWAGTMHLPETEVTGNLYTLDTDLSISHKESGIGCSNGLAWSADEKTLFYIDSPTRTVAAYDFDAGTGAISNKRTLITIPENEGWPDGMTIDAEGSLWVALWDGWKVARFDSRTGARTGEIPLPAARITSCAFGGQNFEDLYITSARVGLTDEQLETQPLAGSLFVVRNVGPKGNPANRFDG